MVAVLSRLGEGAAEEFVNDGPGFDGRLRSVTGAANPEERVARALVGVEFELLAGVGEGSFQDVNLLGRRVLVVSAEETEQRGRQVRGLTNDGLPFERHVGRRVNGHERAVTVDDCVEWQTATG